MALLFTKKLKCLLHVQYEHLKLHVNKGKKKLHLEGAVEVGKGLRPKQTEYIFLNKWPLNGCYITINPSSRARKVWAHNKVIKTAKSKHK